ncbi:hypothetical protein H7Y63_00520 [Polaromonas sp.]|nr:hypothetical protein [Candidatus Saccharibacteria bacterium]
MISVSEIAIGDSHRLRRSILLAVGIVLIGAAVAVLFGWQQNITVLKSVLPSLAPMNPTSAVCFLLLGTSFIARAWPDAPTFLTKIFAAWPPLRS